MSKNKSSKQNIIPPYLLEYIAKTCDANDKECILNTLDHINKLMEKSINEASSAPKDDPLLYKNRSIPKSEGEGSYQSSGK
ncbi:protealysin propeptide domain-containing protein [Xenorhabdus anantnagensis]|uniref:Protealysin propeptide domain-containing protein n=1 Tax=Xenorhabdus anantnagensis TaxID=3025875 RepID=A0ABT5LRT9_9GAMM|nr:protealysin propeptide domain-containing protein [Xenorhabdus anantnagensis]MDC9597133.1 protealysin propeptide domain-containing protein [Xenorhabdus anantnagensis]